MTEDPSQNPAADPAAEPRLDPSSPTGAPPSVQPYTDPVEEEGARFAAAADEDVDGIRRPAPGGDTVGGDLSPDFLAPTQPT